MNDIEAIKTLERNLEDANWKSCLCMADKYAIQSLLNKVKENEKLKQERDSLLKTGIELTLLVKDTITGNYVPDSFTTQPMEQAIKQCEGEG